MGPSRLAFSFLCAFVAASAVATAPDAPRVNDRLCAKRGEEDLGCGRVTATTTYTIQVNNPKLAEEIRSGERILVTAPQRGVEPRIDDNAYVVTRAMYHRKAIHAGIYGSSSFWFPNLHFQFAVGESTLMGLMPTVADSAKTDSQVSVLGSFVTFEKFLSGRVFEGFSLLGGAGLYSFKITLGEDTEGVWAPVVSGQLGYRVCGRLGISIGVGVGAQYVVGATSELVDVSVNQFSPIFRADVGWAF